MPDLFTCPTFGLATAAEPKIVTPLGALIFDAEFDGVLVGDPKPSAVHHLEGGYIFRWTLDGVTAELLLCRPRLALPKGMAVDDCCAGMWRLKTSISTTSGERPEFSCRWEPGYQWNEGGGDSGEGKDAQTWDGDTVDGDKMRVTLGTRDAEWLAGDARLGLLPSRWANLLGSSYGGIVPDSNTGKIDPIVYLEDGFRIVLPALKASEQCQIQFVIAWSTLPRRGRNERDDDASTWFAVDLSPKEILMGAGCS